MRPGKVPASVVIFGDALSVRLMGMDGLTSGRITHRRADLLGRFLQRRGTTETMAGRIGQGDLLAGGVAAAALPLLVFWIGMSPWLAIPLAVATYAGVALLQPRSGRPEPNDAAPEPLPSPLDVDRSYGLSPRELEVLHLMAWGYSNQEIADLLCISVRTVTTHVTNIFNKLSVASREKAIGVAHRDGLAGPDPALQPRSELPLAGHLRTGT